MEFTVSGGNAGADIRLTQRQVDGITLVTVRLHLPAPAVPEKIVIGWQMPVVDICTRWSPLDASHELGPNWAPRRTESRLAGGMPLHGLFSRAGRNRLTVALSDAAAPTAIFSGVIEENACLTCGVELFTIPAAPLTDYTVTLRLDGRDVPYYDALYDAARWWETDCGYTPAPVPDAARMPVNSLWYSYHQQLQPEAILRQCRLSRPLGLDTVIMDDGWQTLDNNRGYAYCGDWQPLRIPEMRALVDGIHATGMKAMLWFSVPFVGIHSARYEEFKDMFLYSVGGVLDTFVLDPRYKKVRDYLVGVYANALREWDLDGLKLDFIDSFLLQGDALKPDPRRDYTSLEDAVNALMLEVNDTLRAIRPDVLIEFRQSYIGPAIRQYGNMLRVGDCPNDALANWRNSISMRYTSGGTAVHSDMLMWNMQDTPEAVATQLAGILFTVPQISVRIDELPESHYRTLARYLEFWRAHRAVLLDGKVWATAPELGYALGCAEKDGEAVFVAAADPVIPGAAYRRLTAVNITCGGTLYLTGCAGRHWRTVNCMGEVLAEGVAADAVTAVEVPLGGMVTVE